MPKPTTAKDWKPLAAALELHVRRPLLTDPDTASVWAATSPSSLGQTQANQGQITSTSDYRTALWYTLSYSCMHFDALAALMRRVEFRRSLSLLLPPQSPDILHIDFGCGPGTASWAVVNALPDDAQILTAGHDHNPAMTELATDIAAALEQRVSPELDFRFESDWGQFHQGVSEMGEGFQGVVFATCNALFGQQHFGPGHLSYICDFLAQIRSLVPESSLLLLGTHPDFRENVVESSWESIANAVGGTVKFSGPITFQSWSPTKPVNNGALPWHPWTNTQLAHIFESPPLGGH